MQVCAKHLLVVLWELVGEVFEVGRHPKQQFVPV
jgi:hypothetical protein